MLVRPDRSRFPWRLLSASLALLAIAGAAATAAEPASPADLDPTSAPMRAWVERYHADHGAMRRTYHVALSAECDEAHREFNRAWRELLGAVDFDALDRDGQIDYLLLRNELEHAARAAEHRRRREAEISPLAPFAPAIVSLLDARRRLEPIAPRAAADQLDALRTSLEQAVAALEHPTGEPPTATVAQRAVDAVYQLRRQLEEWYRYRAEYDPLFTWWAKQPYGEVHRLLESYAQALRRKYIGDDANIIVGDPLGRAALLDELAREWIPYTPEELLAIAEREFAWCHAEYVKAARDLGFSDDWRAALEHVKNLHVAPGEQPELVRQLAEEAVAFLDERELVTIPELCRRTWRMQMMTPERQRVSPYFTGGEVISVSFPTGDMAHGDKLMSLRGNNIHFSRATVHHELIPGHHLQGYMAARYRTHRRPFSTPFLVEGWALYWEMRLWDLGLAQSAEDRIGMLFWRSHRCARIVFSLKFHLGELTAAEAIDYLVDHVGHERRNATAEVRRSVSGDYGPLYQAAYMLGGLQLRALREELVGPDRGSDRQFHDAVLKENSIPIELIRASLLAQPLTRDQQPQWRFAE